MAEALKRLKPQRDDYPSGDEYAAALRQWIRDCAAVYDAITNPLRHDSRDKIVFLTSCGVGSDESGKD